MANGLVWLLSISMARLRNLSDGSESLLKKNYLIGRAPGSDLIVNQAHVSLQHACLRWTAHGWEVKDLGSLNGTRVNGKRVDQQALKEGDRVSFGESEQNWELVDASGPELMVVSQDGAITLTADNGILGVPRADDPRASIYRNSKGSWVLERADDLSALSDQQTFEVDGVRWIFHSPEAVLQTSSVAGLVPLRIQSVTLHFDVSSDEEFVALRAECGGRIVDLGSRGHNYLLLVLARRKRADAAANVQRSACGWIYQDDLIRDLKVSTGQLNLDIFRIRKQFGVLDVVDAASIVQRRPLTKQLRLGTPHVLEQRS